ncbi:ATP-binding protein [Streptomyces sp. NPDC056937]|uniref:ATP-binding protein n=1 Tax=Streptomyces sp. NPDC056937 TaxID=3345969 RepID=UPI00362551D8
MAPVTATATPVPPPPRGCEVYRLALPNTASAAKVSRDFVTSVLGIGRRRDLGLVDDARLCVTEVVTNTHRHTRTPLIRLHVAVDGRQITVSVTDDKPWAVPVPTAPAALPLRAEHDKEEECGRGLALLDNLARAWGWTVHGGCSPRSKSVWFMLTETDGDGDGDGGAGSGPGTGTGAVD